MVEQHTPGPWEVYAHPINGAGDAVLELVEQVQHTSPIGDKLYLINASGKCPALTGCGPTSKANARLIAAAPDMLTEHEVREGDLVMLIKAIEAGDPRAELLVRAGDMLRETRAVIAKARS